VKTLFIVRHAKSSWTDPGLDDFERPLNDRGERDAPRIGRVLAARGVSPDALIASPARRAWSTAQILAREIGFAPDEILAEPRLYDATVADVLQVIRSLDEAWQSAMILGHNPTFTTLVNTITNAHIDNVPTCGVAEIGLESETWSDFGKVMGDLRAFDRPKNLPG
jgi:phosphohistidine phosphatase